jgi:hypothetical protein
MENTVFACAMLFFVGVCSTVFVGNTAVFACNLTAIGAPDRLRYNDLVKRLQSAIHSRKELADGYEFSLNGSATSLAEVGEWIAMERLCCPFLTLQLSASGSQTDWSLVLSGPEGVKPLLQAEFPVS